jgi:hypothetical protein
MYVRSERQQMLICIDGVKQEKNEKERRKKKKKKKTILL